MKLLDVVTDRWEPASFDLLDWDAFLVEARNAGILASLGFRFEKCGWLERLPPEVLSHIQAECAIAVENQRALRWEVNRIQRALAKLDVPIILLKGAAYIFAGLPSSPGRVASDVDILVPKEHLADVEHTLIERGWATMKLDAYDQRYYRTWMHELPPLCHRDRDVVVDVHHNILPETGRLHPDPRELVKSSTSVDGERLRVLAPHDMVLHSAAHLFQDGELNGGLRDLVDLDSLLRHFGSGENFWDGLLSRAQTMDLERPLFYALRYCEQWLGTPLPDTSALKRPRVPALTIMDALTRRAVMPDGFRPHSLRTQLARWLLYVRSHWLRMPPVLLARHLLRKAWARTRSQNS
uniref:Nucleotidyltransferase family protein n=1 Tax=uncultured bacterium 14-4D TaxID=1497525 RepID=A0A059TYF5_9BACT|nr:hypothetical protein 4d10 [uncultured bacterium 14-4D]